ncbi:MAG: hypothetical protein Q9183_000333 [Haloplaca sp. 2 TL-2023]
MDPPAKLRQKLERLWAGFSSNLLQIRQRRSRDLDRLRRGGYCFEPTVAPVAGHTGLRLLCHHFEELDPPTSQTPRAEAYQHCSFTPRSRPTYPVIESYIDEAIGSTDLARSDETGWVVHSIARFFAESIPSAVDPNQDWSTGVVGCRVARLLEDILGNNDVEKQAILRGPRIY